MIGQRMVKLVGFSVLGALLSIGIVSMGRNDKLYDLSSMRTESDVEKSPVAVFIGDPFKTRFEKLKEMDMPGTKFGENE